MNAFQPVPTLAQRRALTADHAKRHGIEQYLAVQALAMEAAIADFQAERLRYELERLNLQPEPAQCCAVVEDAAVEQPLTLSDVVRINAVGLLVIAGLLAFGWLTAPYMARALASLGVL